MNVVEEMSIASSTPVPAVFIFDKQRGINAFAAGYSVDDCVIGVTEGCTRLLTRYELQGVIAHEFSHIINHDMRLNLRLVVFVYGLVIIALLGRSIVDSSEEASDYISSDEGDVGGSGTRRGVRTRARASTEHDLVMYLYYTHRPNGAYS